MPDVDLPQNPLSPWSLKKFKDIPVQKNFKKKSLKKGFYISPLQAPWKKNSNAHSPVNFSKTLEVYINFQILATKVAVVEIFRNLKKDPTPNSTPPVSFWPGLHAARPCRTELEEVNRFQKSEPNPLQKDVF